MRSLATATLLLLFASVGHGEDATQPTGPKMTAAASKFLATLSGESKARAVFAFDDPERLNWHYIPLEDKKTGKSTRKGLPLEAMTPEQRSAAMDLVKAGTSESAFAKATNIFDFENMLREQEKGTEWTRNAGWYFVSVFGTPSADGRWGWKIEGHHVALNFVVDHDKVISATPAFFGTNPAEVKDGPRKGFRNLAPRGRPCARVVPLARRIGEEGGSPDAAFPADRRPQSKAEGR